MGNCGSALTAYDSCSVYFSGDGLLTNLIISCSGKMIEYKGDPTSAISIKNWYGYCLNYDSDHTQQTPITIWEDMLGPVMPYVLIKPNKGYITATLIGKGQSDELVYHENELLVVNVRQSPCRGRELSLGKRSVL